VPWFRMDNHWFEDEAVEAAGEVAGAMVFAVWPVLLAMAKTQNDGGKVKLTYRKFAEALFTDWEQINPAIEALASAGVLSCPQSSDRGATVAIDPDSWRRWNEATRKAEKRAEERAADSA
jgi:hypothetical protein